MSKKQLFTIIIVITISFTPLSCNDNATRNKETLSLDSIYNGEYSTQSNEDSLIKGALKNRRQILPTLVQVDSSDKFEVKFNEKGNRTGDVIFSREVFWNLTVKSKSDTLLISDLSLLHFEEIAVVDLLNDGNDYIFFVGIDGGSAFYNIYLYLLNPTTSDLLSYDLSFVGNASKPLPEIATSHNYFDDTFQKEREFLESIKHEYGFISEEDIVKQSNNPAFAYYYWVKENGSTEEGIMQIRRYKGNDTNKSSLLFTIEDNSINYKAYFKAGVVAYDKKTDEHFVLFHPENMYDYPTVLKKYGHHLIIGTGGEGLVIVNVDNFHFKRYRNENDNLENMTVSKVDIIDSKIIINDTERLDLPNF